ncbi:MAG: hypothetical protein QGG54_18530, partial [Gammaproteobacteria bacterium]|nr:hypothetical protein [Gammaproteobacteria bacterium]
MKHISLNDTRPAAVYRGHPAKVLIPLLPDGDNESLLALAHCLAVSEPVLLVGVVPVPVGDNLSAGAEPARELRGLIQDNVDRVNLRSMARIRVTHMPWDDIRNILSGEPAIDLVVLSWPEQLVALRLTAAEILSHPPCDVALIRGPLPEKPERILVPMRGGPHAERALQLGLGLSRAFDSRLASLEIRSATPDTSEIELFAGLARVLAEMPEIEHRTVATDDQVGEVLAVAEKFDVVVLGTAAFPSSSTDSFGDLADEALRQSSACVIAVKTKRVVSEKDDAGQFGTQAISVLVDRWFAENTFHGDEYADLNQLVALKRERESKISVALPALNEEDTVGDIIR